MDFIKFVSVQEDILKLIKNFAKVFFLIFLKLI